MYTRGCAQSFHAFDRLRAVGIRTVIQLHDNPVWLMNKCNAAIVPTSCLKGCVMILGMAASTYNRAGPRDVEPERSLIG